MLKNTAPKTQIGPKPPIECQPLQVELVHDFPDVPVLPETLLLLDLKVQDRCVDLREISHVVLADLGAALQILRLAGREYGNAEGRPTRIEDCISDLGLQACFEAASAELVPRDSGHIAIAETWAHAREIAQHSQLVAEEMADVNPEEAYLTGLFHVLGMLPSILGWSRKETKLADGVQAGLTIAKRWSLPHCVVALFCEMPAPSHDSRWSAIVRTAHQRASRSSINCPFEHGLRPHLHKRA